MFPIALVTHAAPEDREPDGVTQRRRPVWRVPWSRAEVEARGVPVVASLAGDVSMVPVEAEPAIRAAWPDAVWDTVPPRLLGEVREAVERGPVTAPTDWSQRMGGVAAKLYPFQLTAVWKAIARRKLGVFDEMGCGKTIEALAVAHYFRDLGPVLVICPSYLLFHWAHEIERHLGVASDRIFPVRSSAHWGRRKNQNRTYDWLIVSYALAARRKRQLLDLAFPIVLADEAHYLKGRTSQRGEVAVKLVQQAEVALLLTGTPGNYFADFYQFFRALCPTVFPHFFSVSVSPDRAALYYAPRYCNPQQVHLGHVTSWVFRGYEHGDELQALLDAVMIRRRKHDVLPQLPAKHRNTLRLPPLSEPDQADVDALLSQAEGEEADRDPLRLSDPLRFMAAFRKTCELKIPAVVRLCREWLVEDLLKNDPTLHVLIFVFHEAMRVSIAETLAEHQISHLVISGETDMEQRIRYQDEFQAGQYRVAVLSIKAAGAGLTLTRARLVVFAELLFGPDDMFQAEDRAHRIGQERDVEIVYLILPKTTDDINWGLVVKKDRETAFALDAQPRPVVVRAHPRSAAAASRSDEPARARVVMPRRQEEMLQ